jgi:hypothetical protein
VLTSQTVKGVYRFVPYQQSWGLRRKASSLWDTLRRLRDFRRAATENPRSRFLPAGSPDVINTLLRDRAWHTNIEKILKELIHEAISQMIMSCSMARATM